MSYFFDIKYYKELASNFSFNNIQLILFSLLAFSLPFKMIFANIITGLIAVTFVGGLFVEGKTQKIHYLFYLLASLYALQLLGLWNTSNLKHGFFLLEVRLSLLIFPCAVFIAKLDIKERDIKNILNAFMLGLTVVFWFSFSKSSYEMSQIVGQELTWTIFLAKLSDVLPLTHVYFGLYSGFSMLYILKTYLENKTVPPVYFLHIFTIASFLALLVPKTVVVSVVLLSMFLLFQYRKSLSRRGVLVIVASFGVFLSSMFLFPKSFDRLRQFTFGYARENMVNDNTNYSALRSVPFYCSIDLIRENWQLGLGTGDVQDKMNEWFLERKFDKIVFYNSHNQYFDFLLAFGVLGLLVFLLSTSTVLLMAYRFKDLFFLVFILLILLSFSTENILNNNKGVMFYSFFNSLFVARLIGKV